MNVITTEGVAVFIDVRNVLSDVKRFRYSGAKFDFKDMVDSIVGGRKLKGVYAFDGIFDDAAQCGIHDELENMGFIIIPLKCDKNANKQKGVDAEMTCEILEQAYSNNYDTAIIVSGDGDFCPVTERIRALGKKVEVAGFSNSMSRKLSETCNVFHNLDPMPLFYYAPMKAIYCEHRTWCSY